MSEFKAPLFGCFSDPKLCIITFCIPCFTLGKNAAAAQGENCLLVGLLACVGVRSGAVLRWRLRQKDDLKGSMVKDVLLHALLPCCALIQEAKHIGWAMPTRLEDIDRQDDMDRD